MCHANGDKPAVRDLHQRLHRHGVDPWLDEEELLPGQEWKVEIHKAVGTSHVVLVCLSQGSITKEGYVQQEIKFALDAADEKPQGTIFLIPLRLEKCEVPERIRRWHWVDYFGERGHERLMRALRKRAEDLEVSPTLDFEQDSPAMSHASILIEKAKGLESDDDHWEAAQKYLRAAADLEESGALDDQVSALESAIAALQNGSYAWEAAENLMKLARIHKSNSNRSAQLKCLERAADIYTVAQQQWEAASSNFDLAQEYHQDGNRELALKFYRRARELYAIKGYQDEIQMCDAALSKLQ